MESYIEADNFAGFAKAIKKKSVNDLTPIFENLLSRPQRAQFLKLCLQKGCNRNYVNNETGKAAINYAAESLHFSNLYLLINFEQEKHEKDKKMSTETIKETYNKEEEMKTSNRNSVTINVENSNDDRSSADEVEESIEILPQKNVSETSKRKAAIKDIDHKYENQTALNYLASHLTLENAGEIRECMELLLRNGAEVNTMDDSGEVPLSYVMKNTELSPNDKYELIYRLLQRYTTADLIAKEAWNYLETNHMKKHSELKRDNLEEMISRQKDSIFDIDYMGNILESYAKGDKNALNLLRQILSLQSKDFNYEFLKKLMSFEEDYDLEELLKTPKLQVDYVKLAKWVIEMKDIKLLEVLLKRKDGLASAADEEGIPLLQFATLRYSDEAVRSLLSHGAYMGMRSDYKTLPIKNIKPDILEEHLDSCIQMNDENVIMDFSNISQPPNETNLNFQQSYNDMSTISYIKQSKSLRHLLNHPMVSTFLSHKWHTYSKFFYFQISFYFLNLLYYITLNEYDFNFFLLGVNFLLFLLAYHDVAAIWLDISLGVMSFFYLYTPQIRDEILYYIHIQTFILLFACLKLFSYMKVVPVAWIAKPFGMLFAVINTVLESGILILVVVTFGVCFHIEFGNSTETTNATDTSSLNFDDPGSAIMKSFIMSTGEYEASSANIETLGQYLLLFLFIIIVGISLFNLLVAKALNDIQLIQNQAEIYNAIYRINLVNTYELIGKIIKKVANKFNCLQKASFTLKEIMIQKFNYPLKMTFYYTKGNATDKGTTDYAIDFVSPKRMFFGLIKMHQHLDYNSFKRVIKIAEKNSNKEQQISQNIELNSDRADFQRKLEIAMKDQMDIIQISLQQQTETIKRIETILQENRYTK
ncbi:transient receptor potential cation channel protein painless-like [Drosophila sulfurigaster albostrigata]|uniref:transient receptor potential cation channel protein painless-like n=1 Tax=Drosophila sulfurigaster albostrigata TaxID=89887 RepID=UPI002D21D2CA|nr:transient receptor potential cation channel protein painless-like [Drosophila sulfurigaster albostrigata]